MLECKKDVMYSNIVACSITLQAGDAYGQGVTGKRKVLIAMVPELGLAEID